MKLLSFLSIIIVLTFSFSCSQIQPESIKKDSISVGQTLFIQSNVLNEKRALNIFLPPEYSAEEQNRFPVVFLFDGGLDEDFLHVAGLYQISSSEWTHRVKPSIVVGIGNIDRVRDFTFPSSFKDEREKFPSSVQSDKFMEFLEQELAPYINSHFRT